MEYSVYSIDKINKRVFFERDVLEGQELEIFFWELKDALFPEMYCS